MTFRDAYEQGFQAGDEHYHKLKGEQAIIQVHEFSDLTAFAEGSLLALLSMASDISTEELQSSLNRIIQGLRSRRREILDVTIVMPTPPPTPPPPPNNPGWMPSRGSR